MTSLLDMLKEADLRLNFTDALKSPTAYETLDRSVLRPRLLLCLNGIGTNAGLQRMAGLQSGATAKDLAYVRRRYITVDALRQAIAIVTNGTLHARNPAIWGDGTTACASDSKHFGAWDQNLTTQWHVRYGGRGIMIYWHVERKSLCIHSQLKSPSSSEVASMIEGVVHHCTEMEVDRQYVDSHGQSTVAFAFCRLLGFQLMPRLKAIHVQKLSRPDVGTARRLPEPAGDSDEADRLGTDPPAIRPDGQIRDGGPARHGRDGIDPAPLHRGATFSIRPTRPSPNSARRSRPSSCADTFTARSSAARSTRA